MLEFPAAPASVRVFISYAWEDDEYRDLVKRLAARLRKDGINARLDAWDLDGLTIPEFMSREVRNADRILVLCSPAYRTKVHAMEDNEAINGVGWESMLLTSAIWAGNKDRKQLDVALLRGTWRASAPDFLAGMVYFDLTVEGTFESEYCRLLQNLYRLTDAPKVGDRPPGLDPKIVEPLRGSTKPHCLNFVRVRLESPYWESSAIPRTGSKSLYPFDFPCTQYCYLTSHLERQDPTFDVLVANSRDRALIVLAVGLLIVETAEVTYLYGGPSPAFYRVTRDDCFTLSMPRIASLYPSSMKSYPPKKEDVQVTKRNNPVRYVLDDPICIAVGQPYRFGLLLSKYVTNMPNNVTARIFLETDEGLVESEPLYLFTC
jgi:hypothetical protein